MDFSAEGHAMRDSVSSEFLIRIYLRLSGSLSFQFVPFVYFVVEFVAWLFSWLTVSNSLLLIWLRLCRAVITCITHYFKADYKENEKDCFFACQIDF